MEERSLTDKLALVSDHGFHSHSSICTATEHLLVSHLAFSPNAVTTPPPTPSPHTDVLRPAEWCLDAKSNRPRPLSLPRISSETKTAPAAVTMSSIIISYPDSDLKKKKKKSICSLNKPKCFYKGVSEQRKCWISPPSPPSTQSNSPRWGHRARARILILSLSLSLVLSPLSFSYLSPGMQQAPYFERSLVTQYPWISLRDASDSRIYRFAHG